MLLVEVEAINVLEAAAAEVPGAFTRTEVPVAVDVDGVEHSSVWRLAEVGLSPSSSKEVDGTFC